jgi:dCMP deaminase
MEKEIYQRPTWDEWFMKLAMLVAERSTCKRHHVGAIIVKDNSFISEGYNGAVRGTEDCLTLGCKKDELNISSGFGSELCRAVHAEQNAIIRAGYDRAKGGTMYCTHSPCMMCAKEIVNAGIVKVVSYQEFKGDNGANMFLIDREVKVKIVNRPNNIILVKD